MDQKYKFAYLISKKISHGPIFYDTLFNPEQPGFYDAFSVAIDYLVKQGIREANEQILTQYAYAIFKKYSPENLKKILLEKV